MTDTRGCNIPDDLYYWIDKHVWAREADGIVTIGITDVAQHLASKVVAVTTKRVGKALERGQSMATVESGKWVGPVPAPVGGEIIEINTALAADPTLVNSDPYGTGWIARLQATDWAAERGELASGAAGVEAYAAFLADNGISCA
jgi:glycine cleavage system H protein